MNTEITYLYRDADNYKKIKSIILIGSLSQENIKRFYEILDDCSYFIPSDVGLENLQIYLQAYDHEDHLDEDGVYLPYGDITGADHVWHELLNVSHTDKEPSVSLTAERFTELISEDTFCGWTWEATEARLAKEALQRKK